MNERSIRITASVGLVIGGLFGMMGSFIQTPSLRGLAWGIDGVALILATALLTFYYNRKGNDGVAAGFLCLAIGEGLILSSSGVNLDQDHSSFGAGVALWAASLLVISFQKTFPLFVRITGFMAAILFSVTAVLLFTGNDVNGLTKPLPFFAYPIFVLTIFGWASTVLLSKEKNSFIAKNARVKQGTQRNSQLNDMQLHNN